MKWSKACAVMSETQRVRAEMKGGRDPGGYVAGHGPVGPGEAGPREKAMGGCKGAEHECEGRVAKMNRASPWQCGGFDALRGVRLCWLNQMCGRLQL